MPTLIAGNLNAPSSALGILTRRIKADQERRAYAQARAGGSGAAGVHVIFVCEALMIYLKDGAPQSLLKQCAILARGFG
jgi:hypothetical protein